MNNTMSTSMKARQSRDIKTINRVYKEFTTWLNKPGIKMMYKTTVDNETIARALVKSINRYHEPLKFTYRAKSNRFCANGCCVLDAGKYEIIQAPIKEQGS